MKYSDVKREKEQEGLNGVGDGRTEQSRELWGEIIDKKGLLKKP